LSSIAYYHELRFDPEQLAGAGPPAILNRAGSSGRKISLVRAQLFSILFRDERQSEPRSTEEVFRAVTQHLFNESAHKLSFMLA
jgi:hypothetical protein